MVELSGKIIYLGGSDLLRQFAECDINNISIMKLKYDIIKKLKESDVVIFIDDRNVESKGTKILMKSLSVGAY